ncbi:MAG: hypothetical protein CMM07_22345 [Rhodopirellula sp.]|nr:hypothetical protein [Rhodopirellula sp.]
MYGNVWQWRQDWHGEYADASFTDPARPPSGSSRLHRGDRWYGYERYCGAVYREAFAPAFQGGRSSYRAVCVSHAL